MVCVISFSTNLLTLSMCFVAANKELIAAKGGVEAVVHALRTHATSAAVAKTACIALYNLASLGMSAART
jgi:hypothetical protein